MSQPSVHSSTTLSSAAAKNFSRRGLLGGTAAAVIGWSATSGWVTEAHADDIVGLQNLPALEGSVRVQAEGFRTDFGRFISSRPRAVFRPRGPRDVALMLAFCTRLRIPVAVNGQSGEPGHHESHSNYGQALTDGGIQIDGRSLAGVLSVTRGRAVVGAGTTWAELVDAALATGQTVASLPDYLNLSIGGTISVGGVGGNVQRAGLCADLVQELELVTADGRIQRASRRENATLFRAVLGGAGQYAVITKVVIDLVPAHEMATITSLLYSDLNAYLRDQRTLLRVPGLSHHTGELVRVSNDTAWNFKIDVGVFHAAGSPVDLSGILASLSDDRTRRTTLTVPYRSWAFRVAPFVAAISGTGHLEMKKPWVSFLLPGERTKEFVEWALPQMSQRDLGAGFCLLSPLAPANIRTEMFKLPRTQDGTIFFFDLLAFPDPGTEGVDGMLERNRRFYDKVKSLGGKRYIIGAVPRLRSSDWRDHYGSSEYQRLTSLKRSVDRAGILSPGQRIFSWDS